MTDALPAPPRLPRPMPDPPQAGWWLSPGGDPRIVRYHDGEDWTEFICRLGLRGPGPVEPSPIAPKHQAGSPAQGDPEIAALPAPGRIPIAFGAEGSESGWFLDPDIRGFKKLRYYDGDRWTDFVCSLSLKGPGPITRSPRPETKK